MTLTSEALEGIGYSNVTETGFQYLIMSGEEKGTVRTIWEVEAGTVVFRQGGARKVEAAALINPHVGVSDVVVALGAFEGVTPGLPCTVMALDEVDGQRVVRTHNQGGEELTLTRWVLSNQTATQRQELANLEAATGKALDVVLDGFAVRGWEEHARDFLRDVNLADVEVSAIAKVKTVVSFDFSALSEAARRQAYQVSDHILDYRSLDAVQYLKIRMPKSACRCTEVNPSEVRRLLRDRTRNVYLSEFVLEKVYCIHCS